MADRGPSPLGDPGNLHIYSMNGGSHKLTELVSDVSGDNPLLMNNMPPNHMANPSYPLQHDGQGVPMSYVNIAPLEYSDGYEDVKREPHSGYYGGGGVEGVQCPSASYDPNMHSFPHSSEVFAKSSDNMGYIHMLSNTDTMVPGLGPVIKKEKLDYVDQASGGISCANPAPDIPYPPNTSIQDWNYYNSLAARNASTPTSLNQSNFGIMNLPNPGPQYHGNHGYNANPSNTPINNLIGLSNEDIHERSRKISEGLLNSSWCTDTLYKTNLYSNLMTDSNTTMNRRKRPDSDKSGRASKSRRNSKKASEHSRTSSSDGSIAGKSDTSLSSPHLDDSVLNSSERNILVTTLMNNLRSTVQYESFCLSFPRSHKKERAFRSKILSTLNLINSIGSANIISNPFPAVFVKGASKIVNTFRRAVEKKQFVSAADNSKSIKAGEANNTSTEYTTLKCPDNSVSNISENRTVSDENNLNLRSDQVEEHLPHSMAWVLKIGEKCLQAEWEGQFVVTVNPVHNTMCASVFDYHPNFSSESHKCLQQNKLTKELAEEVVENMEKFEVSRQLRFDVQLEKIVQLYVHTVHDAVGEGCIVIEVTEKPEFLQKWIHTSAEERNKWRRRSDFFSNEQPGTAGSTFICVGGLVSELNELLALMLATNPNLQTIYNRGVHEPLMPKGRWNGSVENGNVSSNERNSVIKKDCSRRDLGRRRKLSTEGKLKPLQDDILNVLAKFGITGDVDNIVEDEEEGWEPTFDPNGNRCNTENSIEIRLDPQLSGCFRDYVNYKCDNVTELSNFLEAMLSPRSHGFFENDFEMNLVPGGDIDHLTVGELISSKCSETVYFSFCRKEVGQLGHDRHCSKCRTCNTWRYWHCDACNKCSYSRLICVYCGHVRDDQGRLVIKPFSVFRSQEKAGLLTVDEEKPSKWLTSLKLQDNDLLSMSELGISALDNGDCSNDMEYNATNAMVDQLGLLNPVGFLLGQPSTGEGRKHRRYKGKQQFGKSTESQGSGCLLQ